MDQRGHNRGLPITSTFDIEDMADDAVAILDALGIDRAIFGGFSLGCPVSLHAALRHRERVARLVLSSGALTHRRLFRDRLALAAVRPAAVLAKRGLGASVAARCFGANRRKADGEFWRLWPWLRAELANTPAASVTSVMAAVARYDASEEVASLRKVPSAVVLTTGDAICHPRLQAEMADELGSRIVHVDGDHDLPLAGPHTYGEAMLEAVSLVTRAALDRHR